jgi:hypothetical protein
MHIEQRAHGQLRLKAFDQQNSDRPTVFHGADDAWRCPNSRKKSVQP